MFTQVTHSHEISKEASGSRLIFNSYQFNFQNPYIKKKLPKPEFDLLVYAATYWARDEDLFLSNFFGESYSSISPAGLIWREIIFIFMMR